MTSSDTCAVSRPLPFTLQARHAATFRATASEDHTALGRLQADARPVYRGRWCAPRHAATFRATASEDHAALGRFRQTPGQSTGVAGVR
ncbi:UNVERIFIED_CONTAM: hypothetical protein FKN15_019727 [Acipenser sinensis]